MKIIQVEKATGLTKRTIRYYAKCGLIAPEYTERNGRQYAEYSDQDVEKLRAVAGLRRAMFSIEQIKVMDQTPEAIPAIFSQYRKALKETAAQLQQLINAADTIEAGELKSIYELSNGLKPASDRLPLPKCDRNPHFKYMDEFPIDAETAERDRAQYAKTDFIQPPPPYQSNTMFGAPLDTYQSLGMRAKEVLPGRKGGKKNLNLTIIIWTVIFLIIAVFAALSYFGVIRAG